MSPGTLPVAKAAPKSTWAAQIETANKLLPVVLDPSKSLNERFLALNRITEIASLDGDRLRDLLLWRRLVALNPARQRLSPSKTTDFPLRLRLKLHDLWSLYGSREEVDAICKDVAEFRSATPGAGDLSTAISVGTLYSNELLFDLIRRGTAEEKRMAAESIQFTFCQVSYTNRLSEIYRQSQDPETKRYAVKALAYLHFVDAYAALQALRDSEIDAAARSMLSQSMNEWLERRGVWLDHGGRHFGDDYLRFVGLTGRPNPFAADLLSAVYGERIPELSNDIESWWRHKRHQLSTREFVLRVIEEASLNDSFVSKAYSVGLLKECPFISETAFQNAFRRMLSQSTDPFGRVWAARVLASADDYTGIPTLIENVGPLATENLLFDRTKEWALDSLHRITGENFLDDPIAWKRWWDANKEKWSEHRR